MRITRQQLQEMIDEAVAERLLQVENRRLIEGFQSDLEAVDAAALVEFAEAYASLGTEVQEQLHDLLDSGEDSGLTSSAARLIHRTLGGMNGEIDDALAAWFEAAGG